jgi:hypothetical protein
MWSQKSWGASCSPTQTLSSSVTCRTEESLNVAWLKTRYGRPWKAEGRQKRSKGEGKGMMGGAARRHGGTLQLQVHPQDPCWAEARPAAPTRALSTVASSRPTSVSTSHAAAFRASASAQLPPLRRRAHALAPLLPSPTPLAAGPPRPRPSSSKAGFSSWWSRLYSSSASLVPMDCTSRTMSGVRLPSRGEGPVAAVGPGQHVGWGNTCAAVLRSCKAQAHAQKQAAAATTRNTKAPQPPSAGVAPPSGLALLQLGPAPPPSPHSLLKP